MKLRAQKSHFLARTRRIEHAAAARKETNCKQDADKPTLASSPTASVSLTFRELFDGRIAGLVEFLKNATFLEIHTGKIHMYFVTSVLYEITCISSNTDKPDTDSNPGVWVLIYMTNTVSTNIWSQKKN